MFIFLFGSLPNVGFIAGYGSLHNYVFIASFGSLMAYVFIAGYGSLISIALILLNRGLCHCTTPQTTATPALSAIAPRRRRRRQ